jgi:L-ascorbate metabolism protein UlaG (beta-lactamase superfamily)
MKITKLAHACLLVEMPEPLNRTVLFDPGEMSVDLVHAAQLRFLDDIVITHEHYDHYNEPLIHELVAQFPQVRILAPESVISQLAQSGITTASTLPSAGLTVFDAPHEPIAPLGEAPEAIGAHYLDTLTHPGDCHHFAESKAILALPIAAPWGKLTRAAEIIAELKPQYVIPIHDWMLKDSWRESTYARLAQYCEKLGVNFVQPVDGQAFVLDLTVGPDRVAGQPADQPSTTKGTV